MAVCMAATACKAGTSWPLGHSLLLPSGEEVYACHVGAEKPKLRFLVDCKQRQYPLVTVVAATVDSPGLQLGTLPQWGHSCWRIQGGHHDFDFVIEQRDCQWIMNIGTWHTQMHRHVHCVKWDNWHNAPGTGVMALSRSKYSQSCPYDLRERR